MTGTTIINLCPIGVHNTCKLPWIWALEALAACIKDRPDMSERYGIKAFVECRVGSKCLCLKMLKQLLRSNVDVKCHQINHFLGSQRHICLPSYTNVCRDVTKLLKIRICRMWMQTVAFILSAGMCYTALGQLNDGYNMLFPKVNKNSVHISTV